MTGYYPWFSIDAGASDVWVVAKLPVATKSEVERCMSCQHADCINCVTARAKRRKQDHAGAPVTCDIERIRRLIEAGRTNKEICNELGCSKATASRYRRKIVISA